MAAYAAASEFALPTRVVFGDGCSRAAGVRAADHERMAARCAETIGEYAVPRPLTAHDFLAVLGAADER